MKGCWLIPKTQLLGMQTAGLAVVLRAEAEDGGKEGGTGKKKKKACCGILTCQGDLCTEQVVS